MPSLKDSVRFPRDILIVAAPIVGLGAIGNVIGLSTLTGGAIINLGYVVAIVFGGLILQSQGSGRRELGLGKPASWWKTALPCSTPVRCDTVYWSGMTSNCRYSP